MSTHEREKLFARWFRDHQKLLFKIVRTYASAREDQEDLFAAVPEEFKPHTRLQRVRYSSHVEVCIPLDTDIRGTAFRRLVEVWVAAARRRSQKARRGGRGQHQ